MNTTRVLCSWLDYSGKELPQDLRFREQIWNSDNKQKIFTAVFLY